MATGRGSREGGQRQAGWFEGSMARARTAVARFIAGDKADVDVMGYEAGRQSRMDRNFNPSGAGPNLLADQTSELARRRIRWLCDNHPLIRGAKQTICDNVVGTGIKIEFRTGYPDLDEQLDDLAEVYFEAIDPNRSMTMGESQRLFMDEVFSGGECLQHHTMVTAFNDVPDGPAVELIDAERLPLGMLMAYSDGVLPNGHTLRQGVELDAIKRPVAYHVLTEHPEDGFTTALLQRTRRLDARDANLGFVRRRIGQIRGVPMPVAAVLLTRFAQKYGEAALAQAMAAACLGVFIKGVTAPGLLKSQDGTTMATDADGNPIEEMEPGMVGFLPANADVVALSPNVPSPQFVPVSDLLERQQARGMGMGFAEYTGDYGRMTFSSSRSESLATRKMYRPLQVMVVRQHTWPICRAFVRWAIAMGLVKMTDQQRAEYALNRRKVFRIKATPNGWQWVNPAQEVSAAAQELAEGLTSPQEICASQGKDWEALMNQRLDAELAEQNKRIEMGLPPKAPKAGAAVQQAVPGSAPADKPKPAQPSNGAKPGPTQNNNNNDDDEDALFAIAGGELAERLNGVMQHV